jgi:hypothetical protein
MTGSSFTSLQRIVSLVLLGIALAGCAADPKAPSPELQQRIEAARTRGDHEALATHFEREAAAARALAANHRKMGTSYQGMIAGGRGAASMPVHCNAIVVKHEGIAADYDAMAAAHRQMAGQAPP